MSNIQAALGLAQFERLDELVNRKREIFSQYEYFFDGCDRIKLNKEAKWAKSIYWMTSILIENSEISRDDLMLSMKKDGIDTRPVFPTISKYPMWFSNCDNPIATKISQNAINLPSGHNLKDYEIKTVCESVMRHMKV